MARRAQVPTIVAHARARRFAVDLMKDVLVQTRLPPRVMKKFSARAERLGLSHAAMLRFVVGLTCDPETVRAWKVELQQLLRRAKEMP